MITINDVIGRANTQLVDTHWLRWSKSELLDYFNDAVNAIIIIRPDAGSSRETISCTAGARQSLPDGALRLLEVIRVVGGRALQPIRRELLDYQFPNWHVMTGPVERYCYDEQVPKTFFVFPGAKQGTELEINVSRLPPAAVIDDLKPTVNRRFPLDDLYLNPVLEWMLFRAFGKDAENGANAQLSSQHYQTFVDLLGVKSQAEQTVAQKMQSQGQGGTLA
ncbi:hypothetical protein KU74_12220 [Pectobacterium brasiliense]|uniref:Phage protein n=1 Tax=Pectobacterium brasiliense TaxID=180957 RepID=A0A0M2F2J1_9GAMM|nr:DUF6682 family protein [Pectobacterium brasiliense]KGA34234.1 hypothetical protein KU74_12220 [Pectobacterium brasiliense]